MPIEFTFAIDLPFRHCSPHSDWEFCMCISCEILSDSSPVTRSLQGTMLFRKTIHCSWICCSNIMEKNITRWPNSKIRKCHHKLDLTIKSLQFGSALWHMHRHLTFSNKNPLIHLLPWCLILLKCSPSVLIYGPLCDHVTAISAKPLKCELTKLSSKL